MTIKIKLMADYGCDPLWWDEPDEVGDFDPATLPLSQQTINRLYDWANAYDNRLNWDDPYESPELSSEEINTFDRQGINLWQQLRTELAPNYEVFYYSDRLQKLLTNPREIEILL